MIPMIVTAVTPGGTALATAHHLGSQVSGLVSGGGTPQSFSLKDNGPLGSVFSLGGQSFTVKPDFISKMPFGASFSVSQGLKNVGSIGQNPFSPTMSSSGLGSQMATSLGAALKSRSLL
jgi:hypothetical protein